MNPKLAEVTLNSFIIVMNIFLTNPASKFGMIDSTHGYRCHITGLKITEKPLEKISEKFLEWKTLYNF